MTNMSRRQHMFAVSFWAALGAIALPASADAAFEKTIVDLSGGEVGSITFPTLEGLPGGPLDGIVLDLSGFTEADVTAAVWELDPATHEVVALDLGALRGDDPCPGPVGTACSNTTLSLRASSFSTGRLSCNGSGGCGILFPPARSISFIDAVPAYVCKGFKGALAKGPVEIRRKRLSWLRATLRDEDGKRPRGRDLVVPPVVDVTFEPAAEEARASGLWPGIGGDGTAFVARGSQWHLLLTLKEFVDPGTYRVTMESGDPSAYRIEPTCVGEFIR